MSALRARCGRNASSCWTIEASTGPLAMGRSRVRKKSRRRLTDASCGAVNNMHDSLLPLAGMVPMVNIMLGEIIFGGVGSGLYGMLLFAIVAVFVAGLNEVLAGRELFSDGPADDERWLRIIFGEAGSDPAFTIQRTHADVLMAQLAAKLGWDSARSSINSARRSLSHGFLRCCNAERKVTMPTRYPPRGNLASIHF